MITTEERDIFLIKDILNYCNSVIERIRDFNMSYEEFLSNSAHRDLLSMPIFQIGELAKHLSKGFTNSHSEIPWSEICGMRDFFAHDYLKMNNKKIWQTATSDVPALKEFCEAVLKDSPYTNHR